ncbi:MAG TPA: hypothetical protein VFE21_02685 [Rubrobacteraceae bacterium]|nr:hypothetical protein [Rubrobacteraceae bacterium]
MIEPFLMLEMTGPLRLLAGFGLIMLFYTSFLGFTYWISKDE